MDYDEEDDYALSFAISFANFLNSTFTLNSAKVFEIGGDNGILRDYMEREYKCSMTIIDPNSYATCINQNVIKKEFSKETDVERFDILIGLFICHTAEEVIISAIKNDKPFAILLCSRPHCVPKNESYCNWMKYLLGLNSKIQVKEIEIKSEKYHILFKE